MKRETFFPHCFRCFALLPTLDLAPMTIASINSLIGPIVDLSSSWLLIFSMQRLDGIVALEEHLKTKH